MKVTIVGLGKVGATTAYSLLSNKKISEIVLVDIIPELVKGEGLDLTHASKIINPSIKITPTQDYLATANSDVCIITAGKPRTPGITRSELAETNKKIVLQITKQLIEKSPNTIIIILTNPVDYLVTEAIKETGYSKQKLFGQGGILDTSRLHSLGFEGMVLGQHGQKMFATNDCDLESLRGTAMQVIKNKGATIFAPSAALTEMVNAIVNDSNEVLPCSFFLEEYGCAVGVPVRLNASGAEEINFVLTDKQKTQLKAAAEAIKNLDG